MRETINRPNVTLADVALRAGVSRMTVSKVLRDTGSISQQTQAKVHEAVAHLGYVKNSLAGVLSSQKSATVGIVIPSASDSVFAEILSGTNSVIRPHGYSALIGETLFDPEIEYDTISKILSLQPAGLIVAGGVERLPKTHALFAQRRCPIISIWDKDNRDGDLTIGVSHRVAGSIAAAHFLERGHKEIGYVGSELKLDTCARHRFEGFRNHLEKADLAVRTEIEDQAPRQAPSGRRLTEALISSHPETTAIFYLNDAMAIGGLSWLYEHGVAVPERVAVAGFNGTSIDHSIRTKLTTIDVPRRFIGTAAAHALIRLVDGETKVTVKSLDFRLILGNTT